MFLVSKILICSISHGLVSAADRSNFLKYCEFTSIEHNCVPMNGRRGETETGLNDRIYRFFRGFGRYFSNKTRCQNLPKARNFTFRSCQNKNDLTSSRKIPPVFPPYQESAVGLCRSGP